jgi:hypothetical protein
MPTVLASARIGQFVGSRIGQMKRIVQFTVGQQSGIGGNRRTAKLEHQAAIEIKAQSASIRFTRRVRHRRPGWLPVRCGILNHNRRECAQNAHFIGGMQG